MRFKRIIHLQHPYYDHYTALFSYRVDHHRDDQYHNYVSEYNMNMNMNMTSLRICVDGVGVYLNRENFHLQ